MLPSSFGNSDEDHPVSASKIVDCLREECSVEAEHRSIYRDIAVLRDKFGMDIDGGQGDRYRLLSRQFEFDDLRILAECVHAAKFISTAKAKDLVETIGEFCSIASIRQTCFSRKCFSHRQSENHAGRHSEHH